MDKLSKLKCITPLAYGGHGKDYIISLFSDLLNKEVKPFSFSDGFKYIIANSLNEEQFNLIKKSITDKEYNYNNFQEKSFNELTLQDKYHFNEYLKNERNDIPVLGDLNMREVMIYFMGKNFIQKIDPQFKVKLTCLYGIEEYNENTLFVANSTRYKEEIIFCSLLNTKNDPIKFFKDFIANNYVEDVYKKVSDLFLELRMIYDFELKDILFLNNLNQNICFAYEQIHQIKSSEHYNIDKELKLIEKKILNTKSDSDYLSKYGIIHIFRSLVPRDNSVNEENYLVKMKEYNKMNNSDIEFDHFISKYKNIYEGFGLPFNLSNIKKYGTVRVNPLDASENNLNEFKRKAILNIPDMDSDNLKLQLNKIFQEKMVYNKNIKK